MKSLVFSLVLLLAGAARADEIAAAERSLDASLDAVDDELDAARKKAGDAYLALLNRVGDRFRAAGDLEGAVATRKEIDRFTSARKPPLPREDWPPLLDRSRRHYQGLLDKVTQAREAKVDQAFRAHADQMKLRARRLVDEDKLDEAVSVDAYLRTLARKKAAFLGNGAAAQDPDAPPVIADRIADVKRTSPVRPSRIESVGTKAGAGLADIPPGTRDELILWNCAGAQAVGACTLRLSFRGKEVWSSVGQKLESGRDQLTPNRIALPAAPFDRLRIELTSISRHGSGLAEVEVFRGGRNIALKRAVSDSGSSIATYPPQALTDGLKKENGPGSHWRAFPIKETAWVELTLQGRAAGPVATRPFRSGSRIDLNPRTPRPAPPPTAKLGLSNGETRDIGKALVTIETERGKGAGFIGRRNGRLHVYTNQHLIIGASEFRLVTHGGKTLKPLQLEVADRQDLARIRFDASELDSEVMALRLAGDTPNLGETVSVFGNGKVLGSRGARARQDGKLLAVGPEVVEVDAAFGSDHSGSPILNQDLEVVGVATYVVQHNARNWITEGTRFSKVRRFGVRAGEGITWHGASFDEYAKQGNLISDAGKFMQELVVTINQLIYSNYGTSKSVTYINGKYNLEKAKTRYHDPQWANSMNDLYRQFGAHVSRKRVSQSDVDRVDRVLKNEIAARAAKVSKLMERRNWSHAWFRKEAERLAGLARNFEEQVDIIFEKKMRIN